MTEPTISDLAHAVDLLERAVARMEIESAQADQRYATREAVDRELANTATLTAERLAGIVARLNGIDHDVAQIQRDARERELRAEQKEVAKRNIVYGALVAAVVGLAAAAVQAGVLG